MSLRACRTHLAPLPSYAQALTEQLTATGLAPYLVSVAPSQYHQLDGTLSWAPIGAQALQASARAGDQAC